MRECWLIDAPGQTIEVVDLQSMTPTRLFQGEEPIRSYALPRGDFSADRIFA